MRTALKIALIAIGSAACSGAFGALGIVGCTDARMAGFTSIGSAAEVKCYSGGKETYSGRSTGKVATTQNSDGWEFVDATTGKFMRVSGDCIVMN